MRGINHNLSIIAAISIAIMLTPAYSATLQEYTDVIAFGTMTENMTLINFDNLGVSANGYLQYGNTGLTTSGVQFLGYLSYMGGYYTALGWGVDNVYDWGSAGTLRGPGGSNQYLRIVLPSGVTAIGMNFMTADYSDNTGGNITITPATMNAFAPVATSVWSPGVNPSPAASGILPTWWGFTSDEPIAYLDISSSNLGYIALDNMQFGSKATEQQPSDPPEVPEAATMILIGTGLGIFSLLRRFNFGQTA